MAQAQNNRWCCECDFCAVSPCDGSAAYCVFLTDYAETLDYYQFCGAHIDDADRYIVAHLVAHPGVAIDLDDGGVPEAWRL